MAKPAFDPSRPFEPAARPAFDPSRPYEAQPAEDAGPSAASTAVHSGLQGMTLGAADELGGMWGAQAQRLVNRLPEGALDVARKYLGVDVVKAPALDAYRYIRDEERKTVDAGRKAHGNVALAAELGVALRRPSMPLARRRR